MQDPADLIRDIKAKASGLEWNDDSLALDKYLGELDILVYKLRQQVISPRRNHDVAGVEDFTKWLDEQLKKEGLS
jgi:hypothetical protein